MKEDDMKTVYVLVRRDLVDGEDANQPAAVYKTEDLAKKAWKEATAEIDPEEEGYSFYTEEIPYYDK